MSQIVFIGEAYGKDEAQCCSPFVGTAGQELARMLHAAGFSCANLPYKYTSKWKMIDYWTQCPVTLLNVFDERPADNEVELFYASQSAQVSIDKSLPYRKFGSSHKYVLLEKAHHVHALHEKLRELKPNLIVPLGNTALWALGKPASISKQRGNVALSDFGKILPTYHPAAVLRNWSLRHITIADFFKARRESRSPDINIPMRRIAIPESISDLHSWWGEHSPSCSLLAVDIETIRKQQISEVGFAVSPTEALWVPIVTEQRTGNKRHYKAHWSREDEAKVWRFIKQVCESPVPKIGQNLKYDLFWLREKMGICIRNYAEDTMVKSHCWNPEMQKSLGFLASLFLDSVSWKSIRKDAKPGEQE